MRKGCISSSGIKFRFCGKKIIRGYILFFADIFNFSSIFELSRALDLSKAFFSYELICLSVYSNKDWVYENQPIFKE